MNTFEPLAFRNRFPCFAGNSDLGIYLDNAATTQLPDVVIETLNSYYAQGRSNVHRSSHQRANQLTNEFEQARQTVLNWANATADHELIWTSGTTHGLNLIANGLSEHFQPGQKILVSAMEHHANLLPWQRLCQQQQLQLEIIPVTDTGDLDWAAFKQQLDETTALVAIAHVSNSLGTCNDIAKACQMAHQFDALAIIDGAQAVAHLPLDVKAIDCDAYVFSGHKMYAPNGIGAIIGKRNLLELLRPMWLGGEMVRQVSYQSATYQPLPYRLEAGTPNIAGALGLATAVEFLSQYPLRGAYEQQLLNYLVEQLSMIEVVKLVGTPQYRCGVVAFEFENDIHPFDIASWLNEQQIAVRCGHHCAMPITERFTQYGSIRVSVAAYNVRSEIDEFIQQLKQAIALNLL